MIEHCHECGQDESLDQAAQLCIQIIGYENIDGDLQEQATAYLKSYITRRQNRLSAAALPRLT